MTYGRVVIQREVMGGYVWSVIPVRDVSLSEEVIALYRHRGTECWWPSHPKSEHPPFAEVTQSPSPWRDFAGCLTITEPGADFSVSLLWNQDWSLRCWYVDIIKPYEPTPIGWDFADQHLDLVVEASGEIWTKDQAALAEAVERGELTLNDAKRAHERIDEVRQHAEASVGVFGQEWRHWRPESAWGPLRLVEDVGSELASSPTPRDEMLDRRWYRPT